MKNHRLDVPGFHLRAHPLLAPFALPVFSHGRLAWGILCLSASRPLGMRTGECEHEPLGLLSYINLEGKREVSLNSSSIRSSVAPAPPIRLTHDGYSTANSALSIGDYSVCALLPKQNACARCVRSSEGNPHRLYTGRDCDLTLSLPSTGLTRKV